MIYANNFVAIYSRTCFRALMEVRENNPMRVRKSHIDSFVEKFIYL